MQHLNEKVGRSAGIRYMKHVLSQGHTLARFLLKSIKPQGGIMFILSPDPLDPLQVLQFDSGHFPQEPVSATIGGSPGTMSPVADSDDEFIRLISELLEAPGSVCLIENFFASAGDPWFQRVKSCVVTYDGEVFHAVFSEDHTEHMIADAVREGRGIPILVGAVGRIASETAEAVQREKVITTSALKSIAETARLIFVGAYDGEGFVCWAPETPQG